MRFFITLILSFLLTSFAWAEEVIHATVTWVSDGDSFVIKKSDGSTAKVRCACIDAPESDQPYGDVAKKIAISKLKGKEVLLRVEKTDKYGRLVCRVSVKQSNGRYMDYEYFMLRNGHVWQFQKMYDDPKAKALEEQARKKKVGLWETENPIAPWEWRWRGMGQGKWHKKGATDK